MVSETDSSPMAPLRSVVQFCRQDGLTVVVEPTDELWRPLDLMLRFVHVATSDAKHAFIDEFGVVIRYHGGDIESIRWQALRAFMP